MPPPRPTASGYRCRSCSCSPTIRAPPFPSTAGCSQGWRNAPRSCVTRGSASGWRSASLRISSRSWRGTRRSSSATARPLDGRSRPRKRPLAKLQVPAVEVDGESVIPEATASGKQEWSARTLRSRISGAVDVYASRSPLPVPSPRRDARPLGIQSEDSAFHRYDGGFPRAYDGDRSAEQRYLFTPGSRAALAVLDGFIEDRLDTYDNDRNDPAKPGTSGLSPYLHFGQISPIGTIRAARLHGGPGLPAFSEQLVVRRELCRNYAPATAARTTMPGKDCRHGRARPSTRPPGTAGPICTPAANLKPPRPTTDTGTRPRNSSCGAARSTTTCGCTGAR
jgi:hypothetical protein